MSCNCHNQNHLNTSHLDALTSDVYNTAQKCYTDEMFQKYLESKIKEIAGQLGISNTLNTDKVGGENKYIKSISQSLGVISAESADIVDNIDDNISSDAIPSTKAVNTKIESLDSKLFGIEGEFIQSIYEKDGIIHPTTVEFEKDLENPDYNHFIAATSEATKTYIDGKARILEEKLASMTQGLSFFETASAGEYIKSLEIQNGKVTATKGLFNNIVNNSAIPPTSLAVKNAISEAVRDFELKLSSILRSLNSLDHEVPGQYVSAVSELNGIISVKREALPKVGNGKLRFIINNGQAGVFAANQENDEDINITIPQRVGDLINDLDFVDRAALDQKVTKEYGKQLSSNDFTDTEKEKLARVDVSAEPNTINSIRISGGKVSINNKVATIDISDSYYDKAAVASLIATSRGDGFMVSQEMIDKINALNVKAQENIINSIKVKDFTELSAVPVIEELVPDSKKSVLIDLTKKVNAEPGKQLSTNDYTSVEKHKLEGIQNGAEKNVQSDWKTDDPTIDSYIKNKPTIGNGNLIVDVNGLTTVFNANQTENTRLNIPIPTKVGELINDMNYLSAADVRNKLDKDPNKSLVDNDLIEQIKTITGEFEPITIKSISVDGKYITPDSTRNVNISMAGKVDKEDNKSLIDNSLISKLENIEEKANNYKLPLATPDILGGVLIGPNITVNPDNGKIGLTRDNVISALSYVPAKLDANGKVVASQLPSFVDDIIEGTFKTNNHGYFYDLDGNLVSPESGKIYVDVETEKTYRWSGEGLGQYIVISETLALGETESTAFRGDQGKEAYVHIFQTDNPHHVTAEQVGLGNVENVSTNDQTPTYEFKPLEALASGEKLSDAFGKIATAVSAVISHTSDTDKHLLDSERELIHNAQPKLSDDQLTAIDSSISAEKVISYTDHIENNNIHVTADEKQAWSLKQDALTDSQIDAVESGITKDLVDNINVYLTNPDSHVSAEDRTKWDSAEENIISNITLHGSNVDIVDKTANIEILTDNSLSFENKLGIKVSKEEDNHVIVKDDGIYVTDSIHSISLNGKECQVTDKDVNIKLSGSEAIDIADNVISAIISKQENNLLSVESDGLFVKSGIKQYVIHKVDVAGQYTGSSIFITDNGRFQDGETLITGKIYYKSPDTEKFLLAQVIEGIVVKENDQIDVIPLAGDWRLSGSSTVVTSFDFDSAHSLDGYKYVFSFIGKN